MVPQNNKIKRFPVVLSGLLFLSAAVLKVLIPYESSFQSVVFVYNNIVFFGIIFSWGIYVQRSILSDKIRRLMLGVVFFMLLYILVGASKHRIFLDGDFAGRFLWYLYYVPQIFATFLAFIIAFRVGKKEEYRLPGVFKYLFAVGVIIVIGYLTNDIHQLGFSFNIDFVAWDQQYSWGPLFYISTVWIYFFLIAGVIILSIKCRAVNKKKAWLPIFWLALGSLYILSDYILDLWEVAPFNLPETHCFIVIAMLESSIRIGIMPSNSAYGQIVSKSSAAFQIADSDNNVIYRSDNAVSLSAGQMEEAKEGNVMIDKNTLLLSDRIKGGYVFWTEDMTAVNEMNEKLSQIGESLSEEGDLIRAENELREQRAKIAEQTRLYDSISLLVKPQLEKISRLIASDGDFRKNMAHICILNCYVKRRSNLALLKDRRPVFSSEELYLSLKESSEYVKLYGGVSDVYANESAVMPSDILLLCYDLWQSVLENILPELYAVTAEIIIPKDAFNFRITADTEKELPSLSRFYSEAERLGGRLSFISEDETVFITLSFGKGGGNI